MASLTLATAVLNQQYIVTSVAITPDTHEWAQWLAEIGFIEGEPVSVIARAAFGGDPMVVRVGVSTFTLRRAEAQCVQICAHQDELHSVAPKLPSASAVAARAA